MNDIYAFTIPVYTNSLGALKNIIEKAKAHPGLDEQALLADRMAPDMFPFVKQVQSVCDQAKLAAARLSQTEAPKHEDTETSLDQLIARIDAVLAFIASIPESAYAGAADIKATFAFMPGKYIAGFDYARFYSLPNFFFHYTTAYDLIRKNGVAIGKGDFVGTIPFRDL